MQVNQFIGEMGADTLTYVLQRSEEDVHYTEWSRRQRLSPCRESRRVRTTPTFGFEHRLATDGGHTSWIHRTDRMIDTELSSYEYPAFYDAAHACRADDQCAAVTKDTEKWKIMAYGTESDSAAAACTSPTTADIRYGGHEHTASMHAHTQAVVLANLVQIPRNATRTRREPGARLEQLRVVFVQLLDREDRESGRLR